WPRSRERPSCLPRRVLWPPLAMARTSPRSRRCVRPSRSRGRRTGSRRSWWESSGTWWVLGVGVLPSAAEAPVGRDDGHLDEAGAAAVPGLELDAVAADVDRLGLQRCDHAVSMDLARASLE